MDEVTANLFKPTTGMASRTNSTLNTPSESQKVTPYWMQLFDMSQLIMVCIGVIANSATVVTLAKNGNSFSFPILYLLRHQSFLDAIICAMGAVVVVQPFMWRTGLEALDSLMCHIWLGQGLFWYFVFLSVWNLVAIAFERFLAVKYPFRHIDITKGKMKTGLAFLYLWSLIACSGAFLQVRMQDGHCISEYFIPGHAGEIYFTIFSLSAFFTIYMLPCVLFFVFYTIVIVTFKKRQNEEFAASRIVDKAAAELTKTAIVVTVVFIITLGYDLWYYMLGYTKVVTYKKNTPVQKVGTWLAAFNSVANPFIYALLMPAYRNSVKQTFCFSCAPKTTNTMPEASTRSSSLNETF